ncbi:alpha-ketoglutarate-dependent dioxygenase AlkB [Niastella sp. OAS944]|uniref:alpha-ketoglutarate-dependent dioxygenase AlkB n=1 Tax=Niastella sp. OAS944 TaxID=2664089 RepID=UPI0034909428|nr:alkylated DNA repair dioxygenase AlkB [Chitinophagaceae bacterium OAS944]
MLSLFNQPPVLPEGFYYYPDFIDQEEEKQLLAIIQQIELHAMVFQGYTAKRKVASFGYDYNFSTRKLTKGMPIPESFSRLIDRVATQLLVHREQIAELLVTEYPVGSVINWHRDAPPFETIAGISLAADCIFKLRPYDQSIRSRKSVISLPVKQRSLYIMQGPARSNWEHSTAPVQDIRYSITIRTLK